MRGRLLLTGAVGLGIAGVLSALPLEAETAADAALTVTLAVAGLALVAGLAGGPRIFAGRAVVFASVTAAVVFALLTLAPMALRSAEAEGAPLRIAMAASVLALGAVAARRRAPPEPRKVSGGGEEVP